MLEALQWPAMVVTILSTWLVGSSHKGKRAVGFWLFLASNALWIAWGLHASAYALVVMQVALALFNVRGAFKNESAGKSAGN
ncbi:MAG: hypothetical protein JSR18_08585 [Proteobacteria bacterium]|nr:hypothetical protein [Pseudomonadota bacterium]